MNPIVKNAMLLLKLMVEDVGEQFNRNWFAEKSSLNPQDINDAIDYLGGIGAIKIYKALGTAPYKFSFVLLESRGRYIYHEARSKPKQEKETKDAELPPKLINPVGSPYGFTSNDWEEVVFKKKNKQVLYVVIGMQLKSDIYDADLFPKNLKSHVENALLKYNQTIRDHKIELDFKSLKAGLGEHLFNQIARDIIGADIAFFETSHLNPNVMLEMGVALTWGIRVVPIKQHTKPKPPSDVSGQTWVDYKDSCQTIMDIDFEKKLIIMIERVMGLKGD